MLLNCDAICREYTVVFLIGALLRDGSTRVLHVPILFQVLLVYSACDDAVG